MMVSMTSMALTITDTAKLMGVGSKTLFRWLREKKVLNEKNLPYQRYLDRGYFKVQRREYTDWRDKRVPYGQTYVTPKGMSWLEGVFPKTGNIAS